MFNGIKNIFPQNGTCYCKIHPEPSGQQQPNPTSCAIFLSSEIPSAPTLDEILRHESLLRNKLLIQYLPSAPCLDLIKLSENLETLLNSIGIEFKENSDVISLAVNDKFLLESPGKDYVMGQLNTRRKEVELKLDGISVPDINDFLTLFSTIFVSLDLSGNKIGNDGVTTLEVSLSYLSRLKSLILSANEIRDKGAIDLARGLSYLSGLEMLNLSHNQIGDIGFLVLKTFISRKSNPKLTIDASHNLISPDRLKIFIEEQKNLKSSKFSKDLKSDGRVIEVT